MKLLRAIYTFFKVPFLLLVTGLTWIFFSRDPDKGEPEDEEKADEL